MYPDHQDIVIAYLTGGLERFLALYVESPIPPATSQAAWDYLTSIDRCEERLTVALVYMLAPMEYAGRPLPLAAARAYEQ